MGQYRDLRGRSKAAQRVGSNTPQAGGSRPSTSTGGDRWPKIGRRPAIPIEDWRPNARMGLFHGAQNYTGGGIVAVIRSLSTPGHWAGFSVFEDWTTNGTEPDWTSFVPVTDNAYEWYPVASLAITARTDSMAVDGAVFIVEEGRTWVSAPDSFGDTDSSPPSFDLGADPPLTADSVSDGDITWYPFPAAEPTITLEPVYGRARVKALPGEAAVDVVDGRFVVRGTDTALPDRELQMFTGRAETTDATPTPMGETSSATMFPISLPLTPASSAFACDVVAVHAVVTARKVDGSVVSAWTVDGVVQAVAASNPRLVGTPTTAVISQDAGAAAWDVALDVDTTNAFTLTVTGAAATTISWGASIQLTGLYI